MTEVSSNAAKRARIAAHVCGADSPTGVTAPTPDIRVTMRSSKLIVRIPRDRCDARVADESLALRARAHPAWRCVTDCNFPQQTGVTFDQNRDTTCHSYSMDVR